MQASPESTACCTLPACVQSAKVTHGPQTPEMHACPCAQSAPDVQTTHSRNRELQPWPGSQSAAVVHEHAPTWQVAPAPGPHWLFSVQGPQTPFRHTLPF